VTAWQAHRCEPSIVRAGLAAAPEVPRSSAAAPSPNTHDTALADSRKPHKDRSDTRSPDTSDTEPSLGHPAKMLGRVLTSPGDLRNLSDEDFRPWYSAAQAEYQRRRRVGLKEKRDG
jgi:hypothetical protein